jgi:hypothetical protein
MSSSEIINPKPCIYNCNTRIYWNVSENAYFEVFTKKKHVCPNRSNNTTTAATTSNTKPTYYNKKPWNSQPKPKMSNSFELLTGPIETVQKKCEILSDIIKEYGGKTHGSQSHNVTNSNMQLIVYYEVPLGQRDEVKSKFENFIKKQTILQ